MYMLNGKSHIFLASLVVLWYALSPECHWCFYMPSLLTRPQPSLLLVNTHDEGARGVMEGAFFLPINPRTPLSQVSTIKTISAESSSNKCKNKVTKKLFIARQHFDYS